MSDWINDLKNNNVSTPKISYTFAIGDRVQVVDSDFSYPFPSFAKDMKLNNFLKEVPDGVVCHIVNRMLHPSFPEFELYGLEDQDGDQYIVDQGGLQSV